MPQSKIRLIHFSTVLIQMLMLAAVLTLLFQHQNQLKQLVKLVQPDLISVAYLQLLVHMQPQDAELRLNLAQQLLDLGRLDEAGATLRPALDQDGHSNWPIRLMYIDIQRKEFYASDSTDPQHKISINGLVEQLEAFTDEEIPHAYLERIARLGLELGRPDIAADLYERLAAIDPPQRPRWLALAGRWHLAWARARRAGQAYHEAFTLTTNADAAKRYALLALDAFRAGNEQMAALALVPDYLDKFPRNPQLLERAIAIARSQSMSERALQWGNQLLASDPTNKELVELQLDIALEAGELPTALALARQLVELRPDDPAGRRRLAQIAEWTGNPEQALDQWLWLARNDTSGQLPARALGLARGLADDQARIEMLALISGQRELNDLEMKELKEAFHRVSDLQAGAEYFRGYVKLYPKRFGAWETLAELQERSGDLTAAAMTWRHIGASFSRPIEAACQQADLLWRLGQKEQAFDLLLAVLPDVGADQVEYWKSLGEQAWSLERTTRALNVYRTLWKAGNADALAMERLILLTRDTGRPVEAIAAAEEAFKRLGDARFLLLGMDVASAADSWGELDRLIRIARNELQQFQDAEMYWLQEAQLSIHEERHKDAIRQYHKALQLNPISISARVGLLWLLIQTDDTQRLPRYLQRWQSDALAESAFWGAYAIALTKLERAQEALPWYRRQVKANPQDPALLLSYSDALAQAGQADAAWRLRRSALHHFRSVAQLNQQ